MDHVFATKTGVVSHPKTGAGQAINLGEHWPADDPIVRAYPDFFDADPRYGLSSSRPLGDDGNPVPDAPKRASRDAVETTTAAPGEKRTRSK